MYRRLVVHDPVLGTRLIPGVQKRVDFETGGYLVRANAHGFRDGEWSVRRDRGVRRVLVYGDSFTFGVGVDSNERFSDRLAAALPGVEVYNFGAIGSGVDQQLLTHRRVGSEFEYDLILSTPWVENIERNLATTRTWAAPPAADGTQTARIALLDKPYFVLEGDVLTLHNEVIDPPEILPYHEYESRSAGRWSILDRLRWYVRNDRPWLQDTLQRVSRYQPKGGRMYADADGYPWQLLRALYRQWASESAAPLLVAPIPLYQHIEGDASGRAVARRYAELHDPDYGLYTVDALPRLRQHSRATRRGYRFPKDLHFSPAGHNAFADAIIDEVRHVLDLASSP